MNYGPIPIVFAVSGHRDLLPQDTQAQTQALAQEFSALRKRYPHSRLQMLNGLAEGADWLAAEVALEHGLELIAVLPMPQEDYEQDFTTSETLNRLRALVNKAAEVRIAPLASEIADSTSRDARYESLGIYLAQHAQCLYALWDGKEDNPLPGGTADVVRLCRDGIDMPNNPLAQPETCRVRLLRANRKKNPTAWSAPEANLWTKEPDNERARWEDIFSSIDIFNRSAIAIQASSPNDVNESLEWLVGKPGALAHIPLSAEAHAIADALARSKQKQRGKALKAVSALAFLSILFQQLHLGPDMQWYWLSLHVGLGCMAFFIYCRFFIGAHNRESLYLDWRALAEGLRVQAYWQVAGINECVSNYYLNSQRDELDWIRHAIRNVTHLNTGAVPDHYIQWLKVSWLESQRAFFLTGKSSAPKKHIKISLWSWIGRTLLAAGLITTASLLLGPFINMPNSVLSWVSLLAAIFFLLAAICRNHLGLLAYEEDANRYQKMGSLFLRAIKALECAPQKNANLLALKVFKDIGKEALSENADWLLLHRQRKFEMPA
jgi:hypothetical protein